jgi:hypothetical protein
MKPCKHLDYETMFAPDITLETCAPHFPEVKFWLRGPTWTDNGPGEQPNPSKVQFCKLRGRINAIFDCYEMPGPMGCYEELVPSEEKP